jgi:hypothetical protein
MEIIRNFFSCFLILLCSLVPAVFLYIIRIWNMEANEYVRNKRIEKIIDANSVKKDK